MNVGMERTVPPERARRLFDTIRARALDAENARHLPDTSVAEYTSAGLVRTLVPERWGGDEAPFSVALDVAIEIGRACGSTAWVSTYYTDHAYLVALYAEAAQAEVWANGPDALVATSFVPLGSATLVDGGISLRGRYTYASGVRHAQWIIVGVLLPGAGHPEYRLALVPRRDFTIVETWDCAGLTASGSDDVVFDGAFIPLDRTVSMEALREGRAPGSAVNQHPMYTVPLIGIASWAILGPAIGIARGGLEAYVDHARAKAHVYTREGLAGNASIQFRIAEIAAEIDAAELLVRRAVGIVERWAPLTIEDRVRNRRDFTRAMRMLVNAMERLMQIAGSSSLARTSPVQRAWRDVTAISTHVTMNAEAAGENAGRLALGLELNPLDPFF
jgi:3-hydroxy-9,10-secoandrosta-1,3,5(10)-triene-9,17-dione monooxygenase